MRRWWLLAVVACGLLSAQEVVVIKAGRVIPVSGPELAPGVVVAEGGRIVKVGRPKAVKIPWNARVIEAPQGTLLPGYVLCHTSRGLGVTNESLPVTPYLSARDSLNPVDPFFKTSLRDGVLALGVFPGNRTVIGGLGLVVKPHGLTVEAMTIRERAGMKLSLLPRSGSSRMAHLARLRQAFLDFERKRAAAAEKARAARETALAQGNPPPPAEPLDEKDRPLADLLAGRLRAFVYCPEAADVFHALRLKERWPKLDLVLVLGPTGYRAASLVAAARVPVVLAPELLVEERDPDTGKITRHYPATEFHRAGVRFALSTGTGALGPNHLWYQAARAVRYGLPRDAALKAVTLWPAEILGIADRCGSLEEGKDLDAVLLTGDPFSPTTWVDRVFWAGEVIYDRRQDPELARLLPAGRSGQKGEEERKERRKEKKTPKKSDQEKLETPRRKGGR